MRVHAIFNRRVLGPLLSLLRQGVTPSKLAWSAALGAAVGVMPTLGTTTALCTALALPLRLNLVAIQAVNWLVYPLQLLLILPFFRLGAWLFRVPPITMDPGELMALLRNDPWGSVALLWDTTWHALVVWLLLAIPFTLLLSALLRPLFARWAHREAPPTVGSALRRDGKFTIGAHREEPPPANPESIPYAPPS